MPITNVNPAPVFVLPEYTANASLTDNLTILKKRLHHKIFKHELNASQYNISFTNNGVSIEFAGQNQNEQSTINKVSQKAKVLSDTISDEILAWLKASEQNLQVKTPHVFDNNAHIALSTTPFTIETGGNSIPKGLKIE